MANSASAGQDTGQLELTSGGLQPEKDLGSWVWS